MRALVIGAADSLGGRLVERLLAAGHDVRVAVTPLDEDRLGHTERLDVLCVEDAKADAARAATDIEIIYDLGERLADSWAAFGSLWSISLDRSAALLEAAVRTGSVRRFVFLSSVAVYRPVPRQSHWPLAEDHPVEAHGAPDLERFGAAKIAAERALAEAAAGGELEATVLRTSTVYGPGVVWAGDLVNALIHTSAPHAEPAATPMQWTHVDDLADALMLGGARPAAAGRTYNITGGELFSERDLHRATADLDRGWPWPAVLGDLARSLKYDIARARTDLGYVPQVNLADGIAGLAAACRSGWW